MGQSEKGMRERMLAGELYIADDPELARDSARAQRLTRQINTIDPTDHQRRRELLAELLGAFGEGSDIRPPLQCDYGYQTFVGARCFAQLGADQPRRRHRDDWRRRAARPERAAAHGDPPP
jgi:maltose O-acetyltransferase